MKKHIYLFSGLGADERAFQRLDLSAYVTAHIQWLTAGENETIENYALRLLPQIVSEKPILIGLSFGGMLAVEVAKHIATEKIILISSAKTRNELPGYYKEGIFPWLRELIPIGVLKQSNFVTNWMFGAASYFDQQLLKAILQETDAAFLKWALKAISRWKNTTQHDNLKHIHGTADHILPYRFVDCDYIIKDGGHLMIINRHDEVMAAINDILDSA